MVGNGRRNAAPPDECLPDNLPHGLRGADHPRSPSGRRDAARTLLVHGATGGVGIAAVDLGKHLGATVIATGGTDETLAVVKKRGADVVFDPVGSSVFDSILTSAPISHSKRPSPRCRC